MSIEEKSWSEYDDFFLSIISIEMKSILNIVCFVQIMTYSNCVINKFAAICIKI